MECYDCGVLLRYAEKKYVTSLYRKRERVTQYRCEMCYYEMKEKSVAMFKGPNVRV